MNLLDDYYKRHNFHSHIHFQNHDLLIVDEVDVESHIGKHFEMLEPQKNLIVFHLVKKVNLIVSKYKKYHFKLPDDFSIEALICFND